MDEMLDIIFPEVEADFNLLEPKYHLRRYDRGDSRYYYLNGKGYISNTSLASQVLPTTEGLKRYLGSKGYEGAQIDMAQKSVYGTIYHMECLRALKENRYSFKEFEGRFFAAVPFWCQEKAVEWIEPMKKDLMCFFVFAKEKIRKVYAIEVPLKSDKWGVAGQGDLVCDIEFNRKEVLSIVDMKSGKKGFFEAHELQLKLLRDEWNETYPELPVTHLFNFAPVAYKDSSNPTYKLENQTNKLTSSAKFGGIEIQLWELYLLQAQAKGLVRPPEKYNFIWGEFEGIENFDPEKHSFTFK